jgi:CRP-like cAMP-binding protein
MGASVTATFLDGGNSELETPASTAIVLEEACADYTSFDSALARKLNAFVELSKDELGVLADLQSKRCEIKLGHELTHEGQAGHKAYILQSGWGCSFKMMPDGGRQIIRFPIPGDCVGLRSILLRTSDHAFSVLTDAVVSVVEPVRILDILNKFPRLGAAFLWAVSWDEAMVVEHLVSIGRRSAMARTAHFFMELIDRLTLVGLATETQFECPLTQYVIADALGLTPVHLNRVLRRLRERQLLTVASGNVTIHDLSSLRELSGYHSVDGHSGKLRNGLIQVNAADRNRAHKFK